MESVDGKLLLSKKSFHRVSKITDVKLWSEIIAWNSFFHSYLFKKYKWNLSRLADFYEPWNLMFSRFSGLQQLHENGPSCVGFALLWDEFNCLKSCCICETHTAWATETKSLLNWYPLSKKNYTCNNHLTMPFLPSLVELTIMTDSSFYNTQSARALVTFFEEEISFTPLQLNRFRSWGHIINRVQKKKSFCPIIRSER
jgi:hypothetical protein